MAVFGCVKNREGEGCDIRNVLTLMKPIEDTFRKECGCDRFERRMILGGRDCQVGTVEGS